jgi:hypothetical protein
LDLSFDRGETFSTGTQDIFVIEEPTIVKLNSTEYYYTFNEQVYIELEGTNLDKSGLVYVRVGDQVQQVVIIKGSEKNKIIFEMPIGLAPATYSIQVSTDGLKYRPVDKTGFSIIVKPCPDRHTCQAYTETKCPIGYYCPENTL